MNPETQARSENQGVRQPRPAAEILAGVKLGWLNKYQHGRQEVEAVFEKRKPADPFSLSVLFELRHRPNPGDEGLGQEIDSLAAGLKGGAKDLGELAAVGGGSVLGAVSTAVFPENRNLQQMLLETMRWTGKIELGSESAEDRKIEQKLVIAIDSDSEYNKKTLLEKSLGIMEWDIVNGKLPDAEELEKTQREQRDAEREKILAGQYSEVRRRTKDLQQLLGLRVVQRVLENNLQGKQAEQLQRFLDSQETGMAVPISDGELPLYNYGQIEIWQAVVAWNTIQDEKKMVKTVKECLLESGVIGFSKKEIKSIKTFTDLQEKLVGLFADDKVTSNEDWLFFRDMFLSNTSDSRSLIFRKINQVVNPETVAAMMLPEPSQSAFEVWRESHPSPDVKVEIGRRPAAGPAVEEAGHKADGDKEKSVEPVAEEQKADTLDWLQRLQGQDVRVEGIPEAAAEPEKKTEPPAEKPVEKLVDELQIKPLEHVEEWAKNAVSVSENNGRVIIIPNNPELPSTWEPKNNQFERRDLVADIRVGDKIALLYLMDIGRKDVRFPEITTTMSYALEIGVGRETERQAIIGWIKKLPVVGMFQEGAKIENPDESGAFHIFVGGANYFVCVPVNSHEIKVNRLTLYKNEIQAAEPDKIFRGLCDIATVLANAWLGLTPPAAAEPGSLAEEEIPAPKRKLRKSF